MPAHPVGNTLVIVIREGVLRLYHQEVVSVACVGRGITRITEREVNAGRLWRDRLCWFRKLPLFVDISKVEFSGHNMLTGDSDEEITLH